MNLIMALESMLYMQYEESTRHTLALRDVPLLPSLVGAKPKSQRDAFGAKRDSLGLKRKRQVAAMRNVTRRVQVVCSA
jgi:hypothetical protein